MYDDLHDVTQDSIINANKYESYDATYTKLAFEKTVYGYQCDICQKIFTRGCGGNCLKHLRLMGHAKL